MLTSLRIQNFKSWADTGELRLAPITGLFGANSSGKSSILQFLLMLKQTAESSDRAQVLNFGFGDSRSLVNLGTFRDVVHGHQSPLTLEWSLQWRPFGPATTPIHTEPVDLDGTGYGFTFVARIIEQLLPPSGTPVVDWFEYRFGNRSNARTASRLRMRRAAPETNRYELSLSGPTPRNHSKKPADLPPPVKFYGFPPQAFAGFADAEAGRDMQLQFDEMLERVHYLGPLRDFPQREYRWGGGQPSSVGARGEYAFDALLALQAQPKRINSVADSLFKLGLLSAFAVRPVVADDNLFRVYVQRTPGAAVVLLPDVGFGVSQVLPVLVLCYYAPEGSTIILEQPEIHLHPAVQAGLADVLIDAMRTRQVQFIVESHSEHLLRRLQRRIAEGDLQSTEAAFYFCESDAETGASHATPLELDEYGNIKNWPKDFFGDDMGELTAITKAQMQRRIAETAG